MVEYGHKVKEKVKVTHSEIKENVPGTTGKGRKRRLKSTIWSKKMK